jgi:hypothetical protein
MLVLWCSVFWGTLLFLVLLWHLVTRGFTGSVPLLRPRSWEGWVNLLLVPFSMSVWFAVAFLASLRPRKNPS